MSHRSYRLVAWAFVAVLGVICSTDTARVWAQESKGKSKKPAAAASTASASAAASTQTKSAKSREEKLTGRLPAHYKEVVTPEQKETIYKIQSEYASRIKASQQAHEKLIQERDNKISAVLTAEQKQKVAQAVEKAKGVTAAKHAAKKAPETSAKPAK